MALKIGRGDVTAGFNYGIDVINNAVRDIRGVTDEFINNALGMKIDERVDFNDLNYRFMQKFMAVNINERDITMSILGQDAHLFGDPNAVSGQAQRPSYAEGMNYIDEFVTTAGGDEKGGINTTRSSDLIGPNNPYKKITNLYPDELDSGYGKDFHKWNLNENKNSILYKTKKLFVDKKINSIISKFGTDADGGGSSVGSPGDVVTGEYGMSHGRNLLKRGAEENGQRYEINGYNNPYCRVWTHHYQYDRLNKLIRPFVSEEGSEGFSAFEALEGLHMWNGFEQQSEYIERKVKNDKGEETTEYIQKQAAGWKSKVENDGGWKKSVLNNNGFVNITPKFLGGGKKNIHTKDCMFSIENLAWRGYDPYSFENALSWEQRGPLGGRIMWFPPYGLSFNETTQANWLPNSFIGRGEDVYTYVNTVRSGTLSFIMLTDHPSIIDYANWYDKKSDNDLKDTDLLRFFAGCDKSAVLDAVKPTPLTDEYTQKITEEEEIKKLDVNPIPEPTPEPEIPDVEKTIQFYVFYPNNYSGCYDGITSTSPVDAIGYLLFGKGCNKKYDGTDENFGEDLAIHFNLDNGAIIGEDYESNIGNGYEMIGSGVSVEEDSTKNYIVGSALRWASYKNKKYKPNEQRKWFYRIDGEYEVPQKGDRNKNTYDQIIKPQNYVDNKCYGLNLKSSAVKSSGLVGEDVELYSLAEVAAALAKGSFTEEFDTPTFEAKKTYDKLISLGVSSETVEDLTELFFSGKMELSEVRLSGYSNSHGLNSSNEVNNARNKILADARANTVKEWMYQWLVFDESKFVPGDNEWGVEVGKKNSPDANSLTAKMYRSTKVEMVFNSVKTESLTETNAEGDEDTTVYQKYTGFTPTGTKDGKQLYKNEETGEQWYETADGELRKLNITEEISEQRGNTNIQFHEEQNYRDYRGRMMFMYTTDNGDNETNKLRYDQEYYFYKQLEETNPIVFEKLTDKLKFFDPAFHSMTPEGFTERLTFLNQCTRQGNTVTSSDINGKTASNLAFGRPPFCVLRIGDFYYQTIVIDSINIDYNVSGGLQWDLNPEGAGVQPMLAQINISFKFIGGGDLGGPIRRLQNAMTFNYYANSRLFDNRADRIEYNGDDKTMGALDHSVNSKESFAYTTQMAK